MVSYKKPEPIFQSVLGNDCPVCGKKSYSLGGIHPQCAMRQADAPRQLQLAAAKKKAQQIKARAPSA
jgi:hypothetical protein